MKLRPPVIVFAVLSVSLLALFGIFQSVLTNDPPDVCECSAHPCPMKNSSPISNSVVLSSEGDILNNPFRDLLTGYYNGTRSFSSVCTEATPRRIELKAIHDKNAQTLKGESFIIRDVCALGHFPKELTHLFTHVWRHVMLVAADSNRRLEMVSKYDEIMKRHRERNVDDLEKIYFIISTEVAKHVIIGNACVTRVPPGASASSNHRGDKYTGVFHKVMSHWIRAIMFPWLQDSRLENSDVWTYKSSSEKELFPSNSRISVYEDYLPTSTGEKPTTCFETIFEREERWRWFPNFEVAHRFRLLLWRYFSPIKKMQRERMHRLLTVPFPKQDKLKVIILRRDEDRHFNEKQVEEFLRTKFGAVANIKMVQYDKSSGYQPPSYYEQVLELSSCDVLIAAHGAALSSIIVMRPGSVVVELFPHNFRYYMYEELAKVMGLEYIAYEGERVSPPGCCGGRDWAGAESRSVETSEESYVSEAEFHEERNYSSNGNNYVQLPKAERFKLIGKIYDLHGNRKCKKCDIEVSRSMWFEIVKNALASVWLANSRLSNLHDFDLRK